jgi:predicted RNA-binding protein YlxR (DUF448 family)
MGKQRRNPTRTCVACREAEGKRGLLRVARAPDGTVVYDPTGRAPGRGAYLHRDAECVQLARRRRALERSLKTQVPEHLWSDLSAVLPAPPEQPAERL